MDASGQRFWDPPLADVRDLLAPCAHRGSRSKSARGGGDCLGHTLLGGRDHRSWYGVSFFAGGSANCGMLLGAKNILKRVAPVLEERAPEVDTVVFTWHSLGEGVEAYLSSSSRSS